MKKILISMFKESKLKAASSNILQLKDNLFRGFLSGMTNVQ